MKNFLMFFAGLHVLLMILLAGESHAAIYKYTDKDGIVCFADDLQQVPEQYRALAVNVEGEARDEEAAKSTPSDMAHKTGGPIMSAEAASAATAQNQSATARSFTLRVIMSAAVMLGAVLIFVILSKQPELKHNEKARTIIRSSLIGVVSLYLLVAHVKDVMIIFGMASKAVEGAQQRSAEKGKKAAQAMKTLDAMFQNAEQTLKQKEAAPHETAVDRGK